MHMGTFEIKYFKAILGSFGALFTHFGRNSKKAHHRVKWTKTVPWLEGVRYTHGYFDMEYARVILKICKLQPITRRHLTHFSLLLGSL